MSALAKTDETIAAIRRDNLKRVLNPRHIAVIGGRAADEAVRQLDRIGFAGPVWPVNPTRAQIQDRSCFRRVADLPEAPDAALVAVPADHCPGVFAELNARGAGGGVCFAAGFAEDGATALEAELLEAAGETALIGPNCHGLLNYLDRVALWPDDHGAEAVDSGFALISQSGNVALNATFHRRSLPLAYAIGTGNQTQIEIGDFIDALLDDARVRAIGLFIEGIKDIRRFADAAWRALERGVPIVALKVGASEAGARASLSHTAALTGSDAVYQALFDRLGIRRTETLAELLETLKLLCVTGPLAGGRVISLSCSGGEAALMGDRLSRTGLDCPPPSPAAAAEIAEAFRIPAASVGNPLDYNTRIWGDAEASARGFEPVLQDGYDACVLVLDFPPAERCHLDNWRAAMDGFLSAHGRAQTPAAVLATLPEALPEEARRACIAAGVTPLQGLDEGVRALVHAARYQTERTGLLADGGVWTGPVGSISSRETSTDRSDSARVLDEIESKRWLANYGVPVPDSRVTTAADAPAAAAALGFPVVLKAAGAHLSHKTELGAVALGLGSGEAVADAVTAIATRLAANTQTATSQTTTTETATTRAANPRLANPELADPQLADPQLADPRLADRWLVERMIADTTVELIVGITRDPDAGPVLVLGSGGILAELTRDTRTLLLPTTAGRVRRALADLGAGALLAGYRGRPPGDLEAAVAACLAVADFARTHADRLLELDINPLLVRPAGYGVVAADALIHTLPQGEAR